MSSSRGASQPGFPCHECHVGSPSNAKDGSGTGQSNVVYFESVQSFIEHLQKVHHKEATQPLHAMHRRRVAASMAATPTNGGGDKGRVDVIEDDGNLVKHTPLRRITGIKNESGQDCFAIREDLMFQKNGT